jgi:hypothetical protein
MAASDGGARQPRRGSSDLPSDGNHSAGVNIPFTDCPVIEPSWASHVLQRMIGLNLPFYQ